MKDVEKLLALLHRRLWGYMKGLPLGRKNEANAVVPKNAVPQIFT